MRYLSLQRKVQRKLFNKFKYEREFSVIARKQSKANASSYYEENLIASTMEKPTFILLGIFCLILGILYETEARSLIPKLTKIEIQEEVEPVFIYVENKLDHKAYKTEKYMAKIDKRLKKLDDSITKKFKEMENLSDVFKRMVTLINDIYMEKEKTETINEEMKEKINAMKLLLLFMRHRIAFLSEKANESEIETTDTANEEENSSPEISAHEDDKDIAILNPLTINSIYPEWFQNAYQSYAPQYQYLEENKFENENSNQDDKMATYLPWLKAFHPTEEPIPEHADVEILRDQNQQLEMDVSITKEENGQEPIFTYHWHSSEEDY